MLINYFRIAIRNLLKNRGFSFINLVGLTIGIASSLLIILFVFYELSYDDYHEDSENVYRLNIRALIGDTRINQTYSSARNLRELRELCPEILTANKFFRMENVLVRVDNQYYSEPYFLGADSSLFDVMTYPFIMGEKSTALNRPNTIVLTQTCAEKYFGSSEVLGKTLIFDLPWGFGETGFEVSAVIEDIPANSHLHFDYVVSLISFPNLINSDGWSNNNFQTYLKLHQGADPVQLEAKFDQYVRDYMGERYDSFIESGGSWKFFLQPLESIHLNSDLNGEFEQNGNKKYIYIFSAIALFVLIIACINFMNLSTAKSALRAREVGVRKITGSTRGMLIGQFMIESVIISLVALTLAVVLTELCLPAFNNLIGKPLTLPLFTTNHWIPILITGGIVIGLLSGIYPAFVLSGYQPITVLTGKFSTSTKGVLFRNILVITQFAASIFLIIGTIVVHRQIQFLQQTDIGFEKEKVIEVLLPPGFEPHLEAYKQEMLSESAVLSVSGCSGLPGDPFNNIGFNSPSVERSFTLNLFSCDEDYQKTLKMEMIEGRFFDRSFQTDTSAMVLNETAVRVLNLTDPIGTIIRTNSQDDPGFHVIGVIKDYHYESLHSEIRPMCLFLQSGRYNQPLRKLAVKTSNSDVQTLTNKLENHYLSLAPQLPFTWSFYSDNYNGLYNNENLTRKVFGLLCILAILVASLGLFGLVSFITEQKRKEIGIRKVMGASVERIIIMLNARFTKWVGLAFLIAAPLAWYVMRSWLQNFEYRQELSIWIFLFSGLAAVLLALLTVSTITWRAASRNPIEGLHYE